MDDQHKKLFKLMSELNAAMTAGKSQTVMGPLLASLLDYTRYHFAAEEALLSQAGYPPIVAHRGLHRDLTKEVEDYIRRFNDGEIALSVGLMDFLQDWLKDHIQKEDQPYGLWLNERGVH